MDALAILQANQLDLENVDAERVGSQHSNSLEMDASAIEEVDIQAYRPLITKNREWIINETDLGLRLSYSSKEERYLLSE